MPPQLLLDPVQRAMVEVLAGTARIHRPNRPAARKTRAWARRPRRMAHGWEAGAHGEAERESSEWPTRRPSLPWRHGVPKLGRSPGGRQPCVRSQRSRAPTVGTGGRGHGSRTWTCACVAGHGMEQMTSPMANTGRSHPGTMGFGVRLHMFGCDPVASVAPTGSTSSRAMEFLACGRA